MDINIREYGAVADGVVSTTGIKTTLNTAVIQKAIDDVSAAGGGRVTISGGTYMTGAFEMKSNVELYLAADAVLLGSPDCADYPEWVNAKHIMYQKVPRWRSSCMIFADEAENISITGPGVIDCNGENFIVKREPGKDGIVHGWLYARKELPTPPRVVMFAGCRNVKVTDVTMRNQPSGWAYWIHDCDYVNFDRVKVIANVDYPNNDGIHINCSRNVTVSNSLLQTGDDSIIVRANSISLYENKPCEKVTITNCTLTAYSAGIRIGWINDGVIRDCVFSNLIMKDCSTGINILLPGVNPQEVVTSNNTAPSDIGRENTLIENMIFSNIIMDKISMQPIYIEASPKNNVNLEAIRNIYFSNIHSSGPTFPWIRGKKGNPATNIQFSDCSFVITDGKEFDNLFSHGPGSRPDAEYHPMVIQYAKNVRFQNTSFDVLDGNAGTIHDPYYSEI